LTPLSLNIVQEFKPDRSQRKEMAVDEGMFLRECEANHDGPHGVTGHVGEEGAGSFPRKNPEKDSFCGFTVTI
jgi:hypothetical protein